VDAMATFDSSSLVLLGGDYAYYNTDDRFTKLDGTAS
jgi:hypothetical protein